MYIFLQIEYSIFHKIQIIINHNAFKYFHFLDLIISILFKKSPIGH